jgi:tRNA G10  N-methylase Trm11
MKTINPRNIAPKFIYMYACHETEQELCNMELESLFGFEVDISKDSGSYILSDINLENNRSPFITAKMEIMYETSSLEKLLKVINKLQLTEHQTFKVHYLKQGEIKDYDQKRNIERRLGSVIQGKASMKSPDILFGVLSTSEPERWYFGKCVEATSPWLTHKHKPQNYSTGLSTVVARALVNIAAPRIEGTRVIDPCCGMGNVVIEGLSMGMNIVGRDINPLAIRGARTNLQHFGYGDSLLVELGDLRDITAKYDAAIVDMPYNLCSVMTIETRQQMLKAVFRFSDRTVIVSSEQLEQDIVQAGGHIQNKCTVRKGSFVRSVWLCCESMARL